MTPPKDYWKTVAMIENVVEDELNSTPTAVRDILAVAAMDMRAMIWEIQSLWRKASQIEAASDGYETAAFDNADQLID